MHIIVVGAGEVGAYLARILVAEGHDVAVVEANEKLARELDESLDALVVTGSGVSKETLQRAGLADADLVLAVTAVDEVNLMTCMLAERSGKELKTVARVREQHYSAEDAALGAKELGLDLIISPEQAVANEVLDLLRYGGAGEMHLLARDRVALLGILLGPDSPLVHESLAQIRPDLPAQSLIAAVQGKDGLRIPGGSDRLRVDERAMVLTLPDNVEEFMILCGRPWSKIERILIIGCGNIGFALARQLEKRDIFPTIIEKDEARAEWVAARLTRSVVIRGDGTDPELLKERIHDDQIDATVVLLEDDAQSLLIGLFAKSLGARKIISRCDRPGYSPLANELGIDAIITPRRAVANTILRYVRRGRIGSTLMLGDHEAEILELTVPARPRNKDILSRPLKDLRFPTGSLVGAVIRNDQAFIADGNTVLAPGDDLLVVAVEKSLHAVETLLS